jgi:hypothetical protein
MREYNGRLATLPCCLDLAMLEVDCVRAEETLIFSEKGGRYCMSSGTEEFATMSRVPA